MEITGGRGSESEVEGHFHADAAGVVRRGQLWCQTFKFWRSLTNTTLSVSQRICL